MSVREIVYNAISGASQTKADIKYVYKITWFFETLKAKMIYLALSSDCLLILSDTLDEIVDWSPVYYMDIENIIISTENSSLILFQLVNNQKTYPASAIPMSTQYPKAFLEKLKILWKTCYMAKTARYQECPISEKNFYHPHLIGSGIAVMEEEQKETWEGKILNYRGYKIKMQGELKESKSAEASFDSEPIESSINYFRYTLKYNLTVDISNLIPINILSKGYLADDLKYMCEMYSKQIIGYYNKNTPCIIDYSERYIKSFDNDISEWDGWQTRAISSTTACAVIIFRRMYIPPLMDSYQYIVLYYVSHFEFMDDDQTEDNKEAKADICIQLRPLLFSSIKKIDMIADSICPVDISTGWHDQILNLRKSSLYLQFDEIAHLEKLYLEKYEFSKKIKKDSFDPGKAYTASVINLLGKELAEYLKVREKEISKKVLIPINKGEVQKSIPKQSIVIPKSMLEKMIERLNSIAKNYGSSTKMKHDQPEVIARTIEGTRSCAATATHFEDYLYWSEKVSNYLAGKFNLLVNENVSGLELLCEITKGYLEAKRRRNVENVLHYLLHLRKKNENFTPKISMGENLRTFRQTITIMN